VTVAVLAVAIAISLLAITSLTQFWWLYVVSLVPAAFGMEGQTITAVRPLLTLCAGHAHCLAGSTLGVAFAIAEL
jgi:hypothetical protein